MADQPGIFSAPDQGKTTDTQSSATPAIDPNGPLAMLVGEGRKYKTLDDLAKAYVHADGFVEKLKDENSQLRQELTKAKTIDDVLERLKAEPSATQADQPAKSPAGLTAQDVAKIVSDTLTGHETARTREANLRSADAEMKKLFGDKAKEAFEAQATTPELRQTLIGLASVSPDKFVALFKPAQGTPAGGQVDGSTAVNSAALANTSASGRALDVECKEFYSTLRTKDPKAYYSHAIQLQMNRAAVANPDKFFGRKTT